MRLLARSPAGAAICAAQKPQGKPAQRPKPPAASTQRELLGQPPSTAAGLPQQPAGEQQAAQQVPASVSPAVTAAALAGSAAVAVDVSAPSSLHLLAPLDAAAHAWVSSGVWPDPALQHLLAGETLGLCLMRPSS